MHGYGVKFLVFMIFLSLTACSDRKEKILGFWKKDGEKIVYLFEKNGKLTEIRLKGEINEGTFSFNDNDTVQLNVPSFDTKTYKKGVQITFDEERLIMVVPEDISANCHYSRIDPKEFQPIFEEVKRKNARRVCKTFIGNLEKILHDYKVENGTYPQKSGLDGWGLLASMISTDAIKSYCSQVWFFAEGWQYKIALELRHDDTVEYIYTESIHQYIIKQSATQPSWTIEKKVAMTLFQ